MRGARVLILEDDPNWRKTIHDVLDATVEFMADSTTVAEAESLLGKHYFNVAIVDVSLRLGDAKDEQGMQLLQALRKRSLEATVRPIILSAYGNVQRTRRAFRDFQVVDFLEKALFDPDELLQAVTGALAANHLDRSVEIEVAGNADLSMLWERFNWPQRESPDELRPELYDLLRRLFPGATHLFIQDLPAGQSGAGVLQVEPSYEANAGTPVIVKFGKKDKIGREEANYSRCAELFAGPQSSMRLHYALGRVMGAISYQLIGAGLDRVVSLADFYHRHTVHDIQAVLDHLFRDACGQWYDNREQPRRRRDLIKLYEEGLRIKFSENGELFDRWREVWRGMETAGFDSQAAELRFPYLQHSFINPRRWLEQRNFSFHLPVWRAMTHGDLNEHNVLVTDEGYCWMIDFYRTGRGHILRDVIELETALKFNLAAIDDLAEHQRLEQQLLRQTRIDRPIWPVEDDPHYKPLAVIAHLRSYADAFTGRSQDMAEYNVGLLLTTLNLLRFDFMQAQHSKIVLSAALMCEQLPPNSPYRLGSRALAATTARNALQE